MPSIRTAQPGDAKQLALIAEATFRTTFGAMNAPAHMERHCRDSFGERIQAAEIADPARANLVVEDGGRLIGYAQLRWGEPPACVVARRAGEIQRLYVVDGWHGKGVAQSLMTTCLDTMEQRGSDAAWLGVWERNPRAISFYRKFGFVEAGEHLFSLGGDPQRDVIMVKAIAPDPLRPNPLLVAAATLSAIAALLHLGCIAFGAPWYRFFGAGEQMAQLAIAGSWYPVAVTLAIAAVLGTWSLYALSGAGVVRRLPLLRTALCAITAVYLVRGAAVLPLIGQLPGRSPAFWWWSSAICLGIGLVHLIGLRQAWSRLGAASAVRPAR